VYFALETENGDIVYFVCEKPIDNDSSSGRPAAFSKSKQQLYAIVNFSP
jgi:hypothetical protein